QAWLPPLSPSGATASCEPVGLTGTATSRGRAYAQAPPMVAAAAPEVATAVAAWSSPSQAR
ncbi:hypothetical protein, partial [Streptomyces anulatus]|uniref:hypothetical protein n=1 Tax=Streptomyces anulatus TaxID=1892 RepID=UPI00340F036D